MSCNYCCPDEGTGMGFRPILSDNFCGFFEFDCDNNNNDDRFVWQSVQIDNTFPVAGSVTITYEGTCADILEVNLRLGGKTGTIVGSLTIPAPSGNDSNSQSITVQQFDTLEIICANGGGGQECNGEYCLNIHYPSPFTP